VSNSSLEQFAIKALARSRITFGDVCRLRRDILPEGVSFRDEAEILIRLDRHIGRVDSSWTDWLTRSLVEFAIWGERALGSPDGDTARWLADELSRQGISRTGHRILREIRLDNESVNGTCPDLEELGTRAQQEATIPEQIAA
jgi:hypothetical protein